MSKLTAPLFTAAAITGEPEVVEDAAVLTHSPAWLALKAAAIGLQSMQEKDGAVSVTADRARAVCRNRYGAILLLHRLQPYRCSLQGQPRGGVRQNGGVFYDLGFAGDGGGGE